MRKSWFKGAVLATALALGGAGLSYAQNAVSQSLPLYRTNDAIFATPRTVPFSRDKDISLRQYLGDMKDAQFYGADPLKFIPGKINWLNENGPEVKKYFTEAARQREIAYCKFLMAYTGKEKRDNAYFQSLKKLENAVQNGVITTDEMKGIEGNVTFVVGGRNKLHDAPMLIYISNAKTPAEYEAQIANMVKEYDAIAKLWSKTSSSQLSQPQIPAPQPPALLTPLPPQTTDVPNQGTPVQPQQPAQPQDNPAPVQSQTSAVSGNNLELIIDGTTSFDMFGVRAGARWKVAGIFGLGFTASAAYGLPQTVSSSRTDPSPTGRYFDGSVVNDSRFKASLDLEASVGDKNGSIFAGVGPMVLMYNEKTSEELRDASGVVKSNSNSEMKLVPGLEAYLGYNIKWFRMALVYDTTGKLSGELGVSVPLGKSENKQ